MPRAIKKRRTTGCDKYDRLRRHLLLLKVAKNYRFVSLSSCQRRLEGNLEGAIRGRAHQNETFYPKRRVSGRLVGHPANPNTGEPRCQGYKTVVFSHFKSSLVSCRPALFLEFRRSYSTVTLLARLRGWSTSHPRRMATSRANSCRGTVAVMALSASRTAGT